MKSEPANAELSKQKLRWFSLTRSRLLVGLLAVEAFILLSENFRWFAFDNNPVRTAQIAFGCVAAFIIVWLSRLVIARRSWDLQTEAPNRRGRWSYMTGDRVLLGLMAVEVFLLLADSFHWFAFNESKLWTALIALGAIGGATLFLLVRFVVAALFRRRRVQFSLRSLLIFTMFCAVGFGWIGQRIERSRNELDAVKAIEALDGLAWYDSQIGNRASKLPGPDWLRHLLGENFFSDVVEVHLDDATDAGLAHLNALANLQALVLNQATPGREFLSPA